MSKSDLLAAAEASNVELFSLIASLDEATMSRAAFGEWSAKHVLAHIAGWQRLNAEMMERMARGEHPIPDGEDYGDDDRMNAGFAAETEGKSAAEVVQSARDTFDRFTFAIDALPAERFEDGRFAAQVVQGNGIDHVREHLVEIRLEMRLAEGG